MHFLRPFLASIIFIIAINSITLKASAETTKNESIKVTVGSDCACGNHAGSFEAVYQGTIIRVNFYFNPNAANPIDRPLKVFKENKEVMDWDYLLCPTPGEYKVELSGKQVVVEGLFRDRSSFEAHQILITENSDQPITFSALLDKMNPLLENETELRLQKEFEPFVGKTLSEEGWEIINVKSSPRFENLYCAFLVHKSEKNFFPEKLIIEKIPENIALNMKKGKKINIIGTVIQYLYGDNISYSIFDKYGFYIGGSALYVFYAE